MVVSHVLSDFVALEIHSLGEEVAGEDFHGESAMREMSLNQTVTSPPRNIRTHWEGKVIRPDPPLRFVP